MGDIKAYELDAFGVVVDDNSVGSNPNALTKAQNAIADPIGEKGSIRKRPGLKKFSTTAGSGYVTGGIGVPKSLGSVGPDIGNPFTDLTVTIASYTRKFYPSTTRFGATWDDDSNWYDWDWVDDFSEYDAFLAEIDDTDSIDVTGSGTEFDESSLVPLTLIGDSVGNWFLGLNESLSEHTSNATAYDTARTLVFPSGSVAAYKAGVGTGSSTDAALPLADAFGATPSSRLRAYPTAVLANKMYYIAGQIDYTVGTNDPVIRVYDGYTDRVIAKLPRNPDVSASGTAKAGVSLLAANGKLYISSFDGGVSGAAGGTVKGSVYEFDPTTNGLTRLGATFPTGHLPYALTWAYGRVWCGTSVNNINDVTPGRVYWFRPGIDTAWTLDKTFAAHEGIVKSLAVFQGKLYAAVDWNSTAAGNSIVYVRDTLGVWTASDTGAVGVDATGLSRGYSGLLVWPPENGHVTSPASALFVVRNFVTGDTGNNAIRKFNGSAWSTVKQNTGSERLRMSYADVSGTLKPIIWATGSGTTALYNSSDGTTWTDRVANLIGSATSALEGLVIQV